MQQRVTNPRPAGYSLGVAWARTSTVSTPAPQTGLLPSGPSCQPCPDCGGLECLCRPRFFAGQLLTEQDLNRLDQYIVAKNQLHNRYLVGHGVVCGLEVLCSPCANTVSVSTGYAIDTCGNDIIVCSPDTVDICKLINACTPTTQINCAPYKDSSQCLDLEQDWILAIRYIETPSRGMTSLTGASQCSCGARAGSCSCGAVSKACGCGSMMPAASCCGQTVVNTAAVSTNLPRRGAPPTCEPTVTCEAYRYEVFPAPPSSTITRQSPVRGVAGLAATIGGEMFERITCCVQAVLANIPTSPGTLNLKDQTSLTAWANFCCNLRQALIQYVIAQGSTDCPALAKLQAISCPSPNNPENFEAALIVALEEELLILIELLLDCVCSAALPPCPAPGDPRVPLASVRVRASDCALISVCDWTPLRKHVVTTKTLGYWLGWLPYVPMLRAFMQEVCCATLELPSQFYPGAVSTRNNAATRTADMKTAPTDLNSPVTFGAQTYQASNPISEAVVSNIAGGENTISVGDLMQALLDPVDPTAPADRLTATPHAKVLAEIARPLVASFGPLVKAVMGQSQTSANNTIVSMKAELDALKTTVATQQAALDAMRPAASPPAPSGRPATTPPAAPPPATPAPTPPAASAPAPSQPAAPAASPSATPGAAPTPTPPATPTPTSTPPKAD